MIRSTLFWKFVDAHVQMNIRYIESVILPHTDANTYKYILSFGHAQIYKSLGCFGYECMCKFIIRVIFHYAGRGAGRETDGDQEVVQPLTLFLLVADLY